MQMLSANITFSNQLNNKSIIYGFIKGGFVKGGFVKHGFVKHGFVKHGLVKYGLDWICKKKDLYNMDLKTNTSSFYS